MLNDFILFADFKLSVNSSMLNYGFLFLLSVVALHLSLYSTNSIFTTLKGSLNQRITINLAIFVEDFIGLILNSFDSERNQILLYIIRGRRVVLKLNNNENEFNLYTFCNCEPCRMRVMQLRIVKVKETINVTCNDGEEHSMNLGHNKIDDRISLPNALSNTKDKIYIMIGGISPYRRWNDRLIGCLLSFTINNIDIKFEASNIASDEPMKGMTATCTGHCTKKTFCNGGQCIVIYSPSVCYCALAALDESHYNNGLKTYIPGWHNSYNITMEVYQIYLKMTWIASSTLERFCLLEYIQGGYYHALYVYGNILYVYMNILYMDGKNITYLHRNGTNILYIGINNNCLTYKINDKTTVNQLDGSYISRINIGFSERSKYWPPFSGLYKFVSSNIEEIIPEQSISNTTILRTATSHVSQTTILHRNEIKTTTKYSNNSHINYIDGKINTIHIVVAIVGSSILSIVVTILYKRLKKHKRIVHSNGLMETVKDKISENPDYQDYSQVNYDGLYHTGECTYSIYYQSTSYSFGENGPQLPPRDEEETNNHRESIVSNAEYNSYTAIDYNDVYMREQEIEPEYTRNKLESEEEDSPQLPPRDDDVSVL